MWRHLQNIDIIWAVQYTFKTNNEHISYDSLHFFITGFSYVSIYYAIAKTLLSILGVTSDFCKRKFKLC